MTVMPFIGRKEELKDLDFLLKKKTSSLGVLKGRRRIGKSRLVQEFGKKRTFYQFSGLAPTPETTVQSQLNEFSRQLGSKASVYEKLKLLSVTGGVSNY